MRANSARASGGRNQWNACPATTKSAAGVGQRRRLGAAVGRAKFGIPGEVLLTGDSHFAIGLDADHTVAVLQENFCQHAWTAADVDQQMFGAKIASLLQRVYDIRRVMRTIFGVVFGPIGKAGQGVANG